MSVRDAGAHRRVAALHRVPCQQASDHLVQPAHRGALARVAEGLQLVVPGLAQELGDLGLQVASRRAAERASAARSRSSGIRMSPWMPVTAWKMPRSGVQL